MNAATTIDAECDTADRVRRIRQLTVNVGTMVQNAATLRRHMAANPGQTCIEIRAIIPVRDGCFNFLRKRNLAYSVGGGKDGPPKWFANPM